MECYNLSEKTIIHDEMIETQLKVKSNKLNITISELINRYIKRGLYMDDYYEPPKLSREELLEISRKEVEKDKKRGIQPKKHNFDVFVGRWNKFDD